jgi:5'-nucleotidase
LIQNNKLTELNIGDNFQGTLWYELLGWNVTQHFLNILVADATTLGNHEFDRGVQEVVNFLKNLKSDVVVANLDDTDEPELKGLYKKSKIVERDGRKIGLVGALVTETMDISNPEKLRILDEIEHVKKESERLRDEEGVDIVIVLSHCGLVKDRRMAMEAGSAIDVIVGGHSHSLLFNSTRDENLGPDTPADTYPIAYKQPNGHTVLIVQASAYTKYVGDLTVYFDEVGEAVKWEGNPIFMNNDVVPDPAILEELKPWKEEVDKVGLEEVGQIKTLLYQRDCARAECNIGNFVTDSFVDYFTNHPDYQEEGSWTYATIGITNAGGIRTSLPPGAVTYDDLFTVLPFQNTIDTFELQGKDLLGVLQISADWWRYYNFLTFTGLKVVYNVTNPEKAQVVSVDVLCRECDMPKYEKLDENKWYRMAVPSFIGAGGNGFTPFTKRRNYRKGDMMDVDVVGKYLKKMSPVIYKKEGRIIVHS